MPRHQDLNKRAAVPERARVLMNTSAHFTLGLEALFIPAADQHQTDQILIKAQQNSERPSGFGCHGVTGAFQVSSFNAGVEEQFARVKSA